MGFVGADGLYHAGETDIPLTHGVSSQYKQYSHEDQKRRFKAEIVQPYIDGKPNPEFVSVYRTDAAPDYFNQAQIDVADRNLGGLQ